MKYALIENNVVKVISYQPTDNFVEDSYDYTDEFKATHQR